VPAPELASADPNSSASVADLTTDPAAVEGQNGSAASAYVGLPEVRKRMKYIFGAMAIGVYLAAGEFP
jgi:hypothetical protein